jgi:hypothetical protein
MCGALTQTLFILINLLKIGMSTKIFINSKPERCGVGDYGRRLFNILKEGIDLDYREVDSEIDYSGYDTVIYNYHYATMPFVKKETSVKQIVLFHEAHLPFSPDTVIQVSELPRPLFENVALIHPKNMIPVIGSFGFGFPDKDYSRIAYMVKDEFDQATIRLNIPFAQYGDAVGMLAMSEAGKCRSILNGTYIKLEISHDFLPDNDLLAMLAQSDINLFLYKDSHGRGISSATDYALSCGRPIGISSSEMFRHLPREICVDNHSIKELIEKGTEPLQKIYEENSNRALTQKMKSYL